MELASMTTVMYEVADTFTGPDYKYCYLVQRMILFPFHSCRPEMLRRKRRHNFVTITVFLPPDQKRTDEYFGTK